MGSGQGVRQSWGGGEGSSEQELGTDWVCREVTSWQGKGRPGDRRKDAVSARTQSGEQRLLSPASPEKPQLTGARGAAQGGLAHGAEGS